MGVSSTLRCGVVATPPGAIRDLGATSSVLQNICAFTIAAFGAFVRAANRVAAIFAAGAFVAVVSMIIRLYALADTAAGNYDEATTQKEYRNSQNQYHQR